MKILDKAEFFSKYGETKVIFSHYHKGCFYFSRKIESKTIDIAVSKSCENILEFGLIADRLYPISRFYDKLHCGWVRSYGVIEEEFCEDINVAGTF